LRTAKASVKSSARVVDIIEYFETVNAPVRTTEVSGALGLPNSSVDQILQTLALKGYLVFDRDSRRYSPSYRLVSQGRRIDEAFYAGDQVAAMLSDLRT
jgi:DNA-binding IclR family transcriptional regulator